MATIGWIDFSVDDRNRVGTVLDLLRPEGMIDELGMGTMRDALADKMFPEISTIQTRAKYFFIIPYILYDYLKLKPAQRRGKSPSRYLEENEYEIMWQLAEKYNHEEGIGVIGITKRRPDKIARRPSAIYWNGLYTYQFINTQGLGVETFLQQTVNPNLESLLSSSGYSGDEMTSDDADAEYDNIFKLKVPPKSDWREELSIDLDFDEAQFLRDRIISISKNKLIAELLLNEKLWKLYTQAKNFMEFSRAAISILDSLELKDTLILAHDFSELMHGAHIAYNNILQGRVFGSYNFSDEWHDWLENIRQNMIDFENFNPEDLFVLAPTTRPVSIQFVRDWWENTVAGFPDLSKRDLLIENQEAAVKGAKARIMHNKTDDVKENGWLGLQHFEYRFFQARVILNDIKEVLIQ
ncbi:MAG: DUF6361 family protein [Mariniphaga sp.]